jgi:hypothetical protein
LDAGGFLEGLDFFFEAAFADFFGAFTLPPTKMIMVCSSCETPLMLRRSSIDCQFSWEARRRGARALGSSHLVATARSLSSTPALRRPVGAIAQPSLAGESEIGKYRAKNEIDRQHS